LKKVIGVFSNRQDAEGAISQLRNEGFSKEISIFGKEQKTRTDANTTMGSSDPISDGTTAGGFVGGLAGLAAGAGMLAIPGLGPMFALGPIAGALTGAVTGGVAGGLMDWGISAEDSRRYEDQIKQGSVLVSVECSDDKVQQTMNSLRQAGAKEVKQH